MKEDQNKWGIIQRFSLEADRFEPLAHAMSILLINHSSVERWRTIEGKLVLYWGDDADATALLTPLKDAHDIADLIDNWLKNSAQYGREPQTDGSLRKGYHITTSQAAWSYRFCMIAPKWIVYGK